jgi:hypothetical protein
MLRDALLRSAPQHEVGVGDSDSERLEQAVEMSVSAVPTSDFDPSRGITT